MDDLSDEMSAPKRFVRSHGGGCLMSCFTAIFLIFGIIFLMTAFAYLVRDKNGDEN